MEMAKGNIPAQPHVVEPDIAELLDSEAARINSPAFIGNDPVQFPRRFSDQRDIEIVSLLAATVAWGKRSMICRNVEKMLGLMDGQPYAYMMDEGYEDLNPDMNIHRTFFARNLQNYLRTLRRIYRANGTLDDFARKVGAGEDEFPSWRLVGAMLGEMAEATGNVDSRCLPSNLDATALKRVNMALRWLVRDDGIVDMGLWKSIPKSKLYIPLDVHVGNTARNLGLLDRKANDRRSVEELTATLRSLRPDDPVYYDYALFGIGVGE